MSTFIVSFFERKRPGEAEGRCPDCLCSLFEKRPTRPPGPFGEVTVFQFSHFVPHAVSIHLGSFSFSQPHVIIESPLRLELSVRVLCFLLSRTEVLPK